MNLQFTVSLPPGAADYLVAGGLAGWAAALAFALIVIATDRLGRGRSYDRLPDAARGTPPDA